MSTTPLAPSLIAPEQDALDRAAFDRTAAARAQMDVHATIRFTLDATYAVGKALWTSGRVLPLRPRLAALAEFDIASYDLLETYARALRCVSAELARRVQALSDVPALAAEGFALRSLLVEYADLLSRKQLVAPELVAALREGSGYRDLVADLNALVQELRALPPGRITEHTPVTGADLDRAAEVAHQIQVGVGNPATLDLTQAQLLDERRKLGDLLVKAQDQLRRGVTFLRWTEKDAGELVPSLYVSGGGRKAAEEGAAAPPDHLTSLHEQLHAAGPPLDPEDNPFTTED